MLNITIPNEGLFHISQQFCVHAVYTKPEDSKLYKIMLPKGFVSGVVLRNSEMDILLLFVLSYHDLSNWMVKDGSGRFYCIDMKGIHHYFGPEGNKIRELKR